MEGLRVLGVVGSPGVFEELESWGSLVAPYFFEVEEMVEGENMEEVALLGGRAGSGGGWVVKG